MFFCRHTSLRRVVEGADADATVKNEMAQKDVRKKTDSREGLFGWETKLFYLNCRRVTCPEKLLLVLKVLLSPTVWKNCLCGAKQLFFSLSVFWTNHLFFPMSMPALNSFSGKGRPIKFVFFKKIIIKHVFCWTFFGETMGHLLSLFLHPFVHLFSSAGVQLYQEPLLLLQDL